MDILNHIVNTCELTRGNSGTIAYYSHLIPIFLSLVLGLFVFIKARFNLFSKIFLAFVIVFSLWLLGDMVGWTQNDYFLQYAAWSPIDYLETTMYILGLYFIMVFVNKSDISFFKKTLLFLATLIPFFITVIGKSVGGFYYPVCEAVNNNFLLDYRFIVEILVIIIIFIYTVTSFVKKSNLPTKVRKSRLIVAGSMFLFLTIFGVTSYLSAVTGYYELNLYALFIIPIFLLVIIYAVFELDIFNFRMLGTQYLVVGLVILVVGQLFFVNGTTDQLLTILTVVVTVGLCILLYRNLQKESDQRVRIEKLSVDLEQSKWRVEESNMKLADANERLKGLDKLKTEFVSLASHQLRSPLTAIKGYASMLSEGDYGEINPQAKETIDRIMDSSNNLTLVVEDLLNVSKIESGGMKYEMVKFDFGELVSNIVKELSVTAEKKGLKLICEIQTDKKYFINGDKEKLRQVLVNLIDNSMKYTKEGQIEVGLSANDKGKIILSVKDTGAGISKESIGTLFKKFARGDGAKLNTSGSGLGLYLVKEIIEAHKGRAWAESEGLGKGSIFFVEIDEVK
jgi:signal transduction histidine kinase